MARAFKLLAGGAFLVAALLLVRASRLTSRQLPVELRSSLASTAAMVSIDAQAAAERLSALVRIPTLCSDPISPAERMRFEELHALLAKSYPRVWSELEVETVGDASLLLHWRGRADALDPVLMMAHLDVVPIEPRSESLWKYPPFGGAIVDGKVWGRGTLDDKGAVCAWLEAVELLLVAGKRPARSVYFAFGHDEEIGGRNGNGLIAAELAARAVHLEFVLDEGGYLTEGVVQLVDAPLALIGIAEKGYLSAELRTVAEGGHSSVPSHPGAIARLARALDRLESDPFPARVDGATRTFLEWIAPEVGLPQRTLLANLWLCEGLIAGQLCAQARTAALVRTTHAATQIQAGVRENVLPTLAEASVNLRLLPGDTIDSALARMREVIADAEVELRAAPGAREASVLSSADAPAFRALQRAIACIEEEAVVAPYLVVGGTDARHYEPIADQIYRFQPYRLTPENLSRFHGPNEFVSIEQHADVIRFCVQLLLDLDWPATQ